MKTKVLPLVCLLFTSVAYGQKEYKVYNYDVYQEGWALTKSSATGFYGFIDKEGQIVVPAEYLKIEKFGVHQKDWALVKSVSGLYGFINKQGEEVVKTLYDKIYQFDQYKDNLALVKSVSGSYGFIDKNGKEVVPPLYDIKEIKEKLQAILQAHQK